MGRITYKTPLANVHKAVREWGFTQDRHAHKIRGKIIALPAVRCAKQKPASHVLTRRQQ